MNRSSRYAVYALLGFALTAPVAFAEDTHHPDQKTTPAAGTVPPPAMDPDKALKQMKENADKLRTQVDKIAKTKDPAERQKLMQEHMQTLRMSMATTSGMMGGMGGGPGAGMGMMMDCPMMGKMMGGGMQGEGMMQRMQQMEKRMDTMQMMMEQMRKP